jgi:hypothetical protein
LREVGSSFLPGLYFDGPAGDPSELTKYAYDFDGLQMTGFRTGEFFDGERVYQDDNGILMTARFTSTVFAGTVGGPVPPVDSLTFEVANLWGPGFQIGLPIVGERSGSTFIPMAIIYGLRPIDRFKINLDYTDFRAFFLLGVPPCTLGEFGVPFDAPHPYNAFDNAPYLAFFDGHPVTAETLYQSTWQGVDRARAGGVGFDLYQETIGCF